MSNPWEILKPHDPTYIARRDARKKVLNRARYQALVARGVCPVCKETREPTESGVTCDSCRTFRTFYPERGPQRNVRQVARCATPSAAVTFYKARHEWLVRIEDYFFGALYCSLEEAYTPEELPKITRLHPVVPVEEHSIPGEVQVQLRQVVADVSLTL